MAVVRSARSPRSASTRSKACAGWARHCRKASRGSRRRRQAQDHFADDAERAFAADEEIEDVSAGREAVADGVLGVRLRDGRQMRGTPLVAVDERDGVALGAVGATAQLERAARGELHGQPFDPVARGSETESARAGGVGRHHAAERGARFGGVERQRPAGRARRPAAPAAHAASCRPAPRTMGGVDCRSRSTMPREARHRDQVRRGSGTAPPATPVRAPLTVTRCRSAACQREHLAQLGQRDRLGHRGHAGGGQARFVVQQFADLGWRRRDAHDSPGRR